MISTASRLPAGSAHIFLKTRTLFSLATGNIKVCWFDDFRLSLNSTATEAKTEDLKRKQARSCWHGNRRAKQKKEKAARWRPCTSKGKTLKSFRFSWCSHSNKTKKEAERRKETRWRFNQRAQKMGEKVEISFLGRRRSQSTGFRFRWKEEHKNYKC